MAVEWIHRHSNLIPMNNSKHFSTERIATTSRKILTLSIQQNASSVVNKTIKSVSHSTPWNDSGTWITIFLYSIIFLLAVIGNLLVILTLIQSRRMRTITNVFLLNLAISDLLLGIFCMPFTLIGMLLRDFIFGEVMCKLLPYLQGVYCAHKRMCQLRKKFKYRIVCKKIHFLWNTKWNRKLWTKFSCAAWKKLTFFTPCIYVNELNSWIYEWTEKWAGKTKC